MSTRAYKIIKIELASEPTINLTRQQDLADFLGQYNDSGEFEVEVAQLKELLESPELIKEYEIEQEQLAQLQKDFDGADDDYIFYQTY